ncbi:hypothetical protein PG985_007157 [Apiospora marii]|uniref:G domain-containing protein n=1 Tax=Apiospora marii TaxID=335849 RepID=A0ABR1SFA3_9PEZI
MRPTEDTPQVGVKDEPESPQGFTMGLPSETPERTKHIGGAYVRQAFSEKTTGSFEPMAILAKESLEKLKGPLDKIVGSSDARRTIRNIKEIQDRKMRVRSLIGVVGGTGAGKSSLINALLGEERLLPTYGNKACTAAATEISWNDSVQPDEKYMAEVELVTEEEWLKEMNDLIEDIKIHQSEGDSDDDSAKAVVAIALAKIQSVYPHLDLEALTRSNALSRVCNETLRGILGTTKKFKADSASGLYEQIKPYMDSTDNSTETTTTEDGQPAALWPLTKVVKVFTKADVLSTGVTLVDLPGCGDSNAARGAVAADYMEQCTSIFVVAPIKRAVDDKLAQHLLGESFKLQMKLDGHYANMTFICSLTDDFNMGEMAHSFGMGHDYAENEKAIENTNATIASEEVERKKLEVDISNKKAEKKRLSKQIERYRELQVQAAQGKSVVAPTPSGKKRKSTFAQNQPAKKQHGPADLSQSNRQRQRHLTLADIESTLRELKKERDAISQDINAKKGRCHELDVHKVSLKESVEEQRAYLRSECIKKRNKDSRFTLNADFIRGHKEMNPNTNTHARGKGAAKKKVVHDDEAVDPQLEVFCVSSRQYQIMCGRCKESRDEGFATPEDTEIPQLLEYTKKSADIGTTRNCKSIVSSSAKVVEFLQSWATPKANENALSEEDVNVEEEHLNQDLKSLDKDLMKYLTDSTKECKHIMNRNLFIPFKTAVTKSAKQLPGIVRKWAEEKVDGRYRYPAATYKAILRRKGEYRKNGKDINFNEDLAMPLKQFIANDWELTFEQQLPEVLKKFCGDIENRMLTFHDALRLRLQGTAVATRVELLESQLRDFHIHGIKNHQETFRADIVRKQREASRMLTLNVKDEMEATYEKCIKHKGLGAIGKMRKVIQAQANTKNGKAMLMAVTEQVEDSLNVMTEEYTKEMVKLVEETIESMKSDYRSCITKRDEPVAPLKIRREILRIIDEIDEEFRDRFISAPEDTSEATATMDIDT